MRHAKPFAPGELAGLLDVTPGGYRTVAVRLRQAAGHTARDRCIAFK
jgi:hypothetical protein